MWSLKPSSREPNINYTPYTQCISIHILSRYSPRDLPISAFIHLLTANDSIASGEKLVESQFETR